MRTLYCFAVKSKESGGKSFLFKLKVLKRHEEARCLTRTIHDLRFATLLRNKAVQDPYIASLLKTPPKEVKICD